MKNKSRQKLAKGTAKRLYLLREEIGWSASEMARETGTSWQQVDRYEKAEICPGALFLYNLRLATGVDLNWLITGEE